MAKIHYRCCSRAAPTILSATLYDAIKDTMISRTADGRALNQNVLERRQGCPDAHDVVLNVYTRSPNSLFAEILRVEPGAHLVTVRQSANSQETLEVAQYTAPDGDTPLRGAAYIFVTGDHLLYTTRGQISSRCMETYLTWLLRKVPAVLPADNALSLETLTPRRDSVPAREMRLQMRPIENEAPEQQTDGGAPIVRRRPASESILQSLAVTDADLGRMIGEGQLEVDVILKFKAGYRNRSVEVGTLDRIFRHAEDVEDVSFVGPNGPVSALGTRLQGDKRIATIGSMFDATDARQRLAEQFGEWVEQGHINV